jgi:hypothetical protein
LTSPLTKTVRDSKRCWSMGVKGVGTAVTGVSGFFSLCLVIAR